MRILHVVEGLELTSGVSLFCIEMCNRQAEAGHEVTLLYRYRYEYKPSGAVRVIESNTLDVFDGHPDIVHIHGLWAPFNARALSWCLRHHVPYVVSPHGALMPWAMQNGRLKKWIFFHFFIKPLMLKASCLHVTTEAEKDACMMLGLKCDYSIVPLGVKMPVLCDSVSNGNCIKTVLFLSRVSKEKGVENLLDVWKKIDTTGWRLVVAGPSWRGYSEELERKIQAEGIVGVEFVGAVLGNEKEKIYRSADLFVLPSYAENFGSVVVEALSYGVPVIATQGTPWSVLEESKSGWWIANNVESLAATIRMAMSLDDSNRKEMGARGRKLVAERYTWESACGRLLESYRQIVFHK